MFDHLLESSHRDHSNKWSNMCFSEEIIQGELIEVNFMHLIWSSSGLCVGLTSFQLLKCPPSQ